MHTLPVAVLLETTNPSLLAFTHQFSVIPPLGTACFTLRSQSTDHPPVSATAANVLVRSLMVLTAKTDQESLCAMFSKPGPHIFKDATIPVSFVGPQVVEFLLSMSRLSTTVDIPLIRSKSVPFCVNNRDVNGNSVMSSAIGLGNVDVVRVMVESGFVVDRFLHEEAVVNGVDIMEVLCMSYLDLDINSVDSRGQTPLHICAYHGDVLHKAATINDVNGLEKCLAEGARVDMKDQNGWTVLHRAAFKGQVESVEFLLDQGAHVDMVDNIGCTAVHQAVGAGHTQVAVLLVARGAEANTKSLIDHVDFDLDCVNNHHAFSGFSLPNDIFVNNSGFVHHVHKQEAMYFDPHSTYELRGMGKSGYGGQNRDTSMSKLREYFSFFYFVSLYLLMAFQIVTPIRYAPSSFSLLALSSLIHSPLDFIRQTSDSVTFSNSFHQQLNQPTD
ncbi:hypothetical protein L1987_21846 [Smallanthus sonchifolius]|uniref:Uncharacterized protein n=1 Tax=Smallanthus sonchifolius TaxID=185202 RepID=A0ACB9ICK7_9ASTR|nr:hypothetical protein L1987_21846 [Smallanthus sonchifolius]